MAFVTAAAWRGLPFGTPFRVPGMPETLYKKQRMNMKKKKRLKEILSEPEIEEYSKALRELFGHDFPNILKERATIAEDTIRKHSLITKFKDTREKKGLTIKEVSSELQIPQYRLKAIEQGYGSELKPEMFWKYCEFLDISGFVQKWIDQNQDLSKRLGLLEANTGEEDR